MPDVKHPSTAADLMGAPPADQHGANAPQQDKFAKPGAGETDNQPRDLLGRAKIAGIASRLAGTVQHLVDTTSEAIRDKTGTINAVDILINQHVETRSFLSRIASVTDPVSRHRLLQTMCDGLAAHMHIEEEIFYPAMEKEGIRPSDKVKESEKEHAEAKDLFVQLLELQPSSATFDPSFKKLRSALEEHMDEEENVFFPKCKEKCDAQLLKTLGHSMHVRFGEILALKQPRMKAAHDLGKAAPVEAYDKPASS